MELLVVIGVLALVSLVFVVIHLRPLTEDEVRLLANKRRNKHIRMHFSFDNREFTVNKEFKRKMSPDGAFYQLNESLYKFPSLAAGLLKYKKHEWVIIAFEGGKRVFLAWLNKGLSRESVSSHLSAEEIAVVAKKKDATSVLCLHNHPNPAPGYLDCTRRSEQDIETARVRSSVLNERGINLVSFVCERGRHYEYSRSPANAFLPLAEFIEAINRVNDQSKLGNLSLHIERIF
ncbi:MAG: hypothetical protein ACE5I2_00265 [Anaerolineae bacterium]